MDESDSSSRGSVTVDTILKHFGKKGMKWGQHKSPVSASGYPGSGFIRVEGGDSLTKKQAGSLAKIAQDTQLTTTNVSPKFHSDIAAINSKYDKTKFSKDIKSDPQQQKYRSECRRVYESHVATRLPEGLHVKVMENIDPSRPAYVVIGNKSGVALETGLLSKEGFKHSGASSNVKQFVLIEEVDVSGLIVDMHLGNEIKHSDDPAEDVLAHWGRKGMRWGRRKAETSTTDATELNPVSLYSRPGKGITRTEGGQGRLPSSDAKDAAVSRQIARKSGVSALTNAQLGNLTKRINLEQQYSKIASAEAEGQKSAARRFIAKLFTKEKDVFLSGKGKGPMVLAVSALLAKKAASAGKHRDAAFPIGALKRTGYAGTHRK